MHRNERRIFVRVNTDFPVKITHPIAQLVTDAQCCDASAAGVGLITENRLLPATSLKLQLRIPNGHAPFESLARVVWSKQVQENKWRSGLEFAQINLMAMRRVYEKADIKA